MKVDSIADRIQTIGEILSTKYEQIKNSALGISEIGIPVGFHDYDAITQGLSRRGLITIGGRPSMGKTSFALNIALNIAKSQDLPVCLFHLELSKEQISNRLLAMELGIEPCRLRAGRLQIDEWNLLGEGIFSLSQLPIHISDTPPSSIYEMQQICQFHVSIKQKMLQYMILKKYNRIKFLNIQKKRSKIQMNHPQN